MFFQATTLVLMVVPMILFLISYDALSFRGRIKRLVVFVGFNKDIIPLSVFIDSFWNKKLVSLMMLRLPIFDALRFVVVLLLIVYFALSIQVSAYASDNGITVANAFLSPPGVPLPEEFSRLSLVLIMLIVLTVFIYFAKGHILKDIDDVEAQINSYKEEKIGSAESNE